MHFRSLSRRSSALLLVLGVVASVPSFADTVRPGRLMTTPPTTETTPPPAVVPPVTTVTPPPTTVTPPPTLFTPPTLPTTPIFLGSDPQIGGLPTLQDLVQRLNGRIDVFNGSSANDLPDAALDGARAITGTPIITQTVTQVSTPAPTVTVTEQTDSSRPGRLMSTPPVVTPPPAVTAPVVTTTVTGITIDVTGLSYIVFNLGNTNYHYYVGNLAGEQTFQGIAPLSSYGFVTSRSALVAAVPEGGSALMLLGGVLLVFGTFRYFRTRTS